MDKAIIHLEIRRCRKHYLLLRKTFATDIERIESVGEVRAFFQVALVRLARLFEAYLLLVKAFLRLFRVHDEFDGLNIGGGHKRSVLLLFGVSKISTLGYSYKTAKIIS